ncbi:hypothetical protein CDCA_CDCA17G4432 [Cyanidium caldarium]|uniref:Diphthamide biosynthesis protein 3 n=1 Tax=Cyanidium caldarium TaxID=2771 RepID=A0AAV9J1C5_CYACA|nr:hypothetical protein CDCA_CDCA17G4432 [Cyanidium caldarium]
MWYDEVELEDMERDDQQQRFTYPCPCGDVFILTFADMRDGEEVARCPSCSLILRVVYDAADLPAGSGDISTAVLPDDIAAH